MIPLWYNHLKNKDEQDKFKKYIYGSKTLLERQAQIIEDWENELDQSETDKDQYNSPSWAALQADRNGYRRALRRFKKLTTLDQKEK